MGRSYDDDDIFALACFVTATVTVAGWKLAGYPVRE